MIFFILYHPEHGSLTIMLSKVYCSVELGNDLPIPTVHEAHDPLLCTNSYHFIEYGIVLPNHVVSIHILSLMCDFGRLQNHCGRSPTETWSKIWNLLQS